jgi:hypothetical protein
MQSLITGGLEVGKAEDYTVVIISAIALFTQIATIQYGYIPSASDPSTNMQTSVPVFS